MTRLEKVIGKRQPDPHVSYVAYMHMLREHRRLTVEATYWRTVAHLWFLQAGRTREDPIGNVFAHSVLLEMHKRDVPELTEEDAPWLALL